MNFSDKESNSEADFGSSSFIFKLPMIGNVTDEGSNVDLKWLNEQSLKITDLQELFWQNYIVLSKAGNHPPALLRSLMNIIQALSDYNICLQEQQKSRQGYIQNESDLQEVMGQMEGFFKNFKDKF